MKTRFNYLFIPAILAILLSFSACEKISRNYPDNCIETMISVLGKQTPALVHLGDELWLIPDENNGDSFSAHFILESQIEKDGKVIQNSRYSLYCTFKDVGYSIRNGQIQFNKRWIDVDFVESVNYHINEDHSLTYRPKGQIMFDGYITGDETTLTPYYGPVKSTTGGLKLKLRIEQKEFHICVKTVSTGFDCAYPISLEEESEAEAPAPAKVV